MPEEAMLNIAGDRREKHVELHQAINNLDGIAEHLDELICRIEGPRPEAASTDESPKGDPSLAEVLATGPEAILNKTERAHSRIQRIAELLF